MKVGDLIRWDNGYHEVIHGIVTEIKVISGQLVHAWIEWPGNDDKNGYYPVKYWALEVISENR